MSDTEELTLRLTLQFSVVLQSRLLETLSEEELSSLRREAEAELAEPGRWDTTFTLIQSLGTLEAERNGDFVSDSEERFALGADHARADR